MSKPHLSGINNGRAKLTVAIVLELYEAEGTHKDLAKQFGISPSAVGKIKRGESWASITQKRSKDSSTTPETA